MTAEKQGDVPVKSAEMPHVMKTPRWVAAELILLESQKNKAKLATKQCHGFNTVLYRQTWA